LREREAPLLREREPPREREAVREREPPRDREPAREREATREREVPRDPEPPREAIRERGISRDREPPREREAARAAQQPAAQVEGQFGPAADQNLADMAQRLEAALRRPGKPEAAADSKVKAANGELTAQAPPAEPMVVAAAEPIALEPRVARGDGKPVREARATGQRSSMYDSLEQEMASLLGRPGKN
jgi:hypothetical protein